MTISYTAAIQSEVYCVIYSAALVSEYTTPLYGALRICSTTHQAMPISYDYLCHRLFYKSLWYSY